jgi:predicted Zn-dependent protease
MIKKYTYALFILVLLVGSPLNFSQGKAVYQKPTSSEKVENYYDSQESARPGYFKEFYSELSGIDKTIETYGETENEHNYNKRNFTNFTSHSNNYFRIEDSKNSLWNGKHWENEDFPLKVYFKKSSSKHFRGKYKSYIDYAFKIWEAADERLKFEYTKSSADADIIISFEDNLMEKYNENYLGLTEYDLERNKKIIRSYIEISLLKFDNQKVSEGEIKATIIHEFGHSLGLGHSNDHADLMYPYISKDSSNELTYIELSTGDIEAIGSAIDLGYKNFSSK